MPNEFTVIGHDRDDDALLLLGDDGQHYAYDLPHDRLTPADLSDEWVVEGGAGADGTGGAAVPAPGLE